MKKNKILGWLAALAVVAGTCIYSIASGPDYMNTEYDENCEARLFICGTVEG